MEKHFISHARILRVNALIADAFIFGLMNYESERDKMILTPKVQEKLFELSKRRFSNWSTRQVSGYVHGIVDGLTRKKPQRVYVRNYDLYDPYAMGYILGFIDAQGLDAFASPWARSLGFCAGIIYYRWWDKCLNETDNG